MRYFFIALFGLLSVFLLASLPAHAASNVLLPPASSSGSSSSLPNLGISPSAPPAATPSDPMPNLSTGASSSQTPPQTPAPPTTRPTRSEIITPVNPTTAKNLAPGVIPTQIIHQTDDSEDYAKATANLPSGLTIKFDGKSFLGAKDIKSIGDKIGLTRDQIPTSCYLSVGGLIQTDKGSAAIESGLSPQVTVRYAGIIKNYLMMAEALCSPGSTVPSGSGYLNEIGDRILIPLQQIKCDPPTLQVSTLTITYDGSGASRCAYQ